jgi:hypothetical protein
VGWNDGRGSGELLHDVHAGNKFLHTGDGKQQRGFGTSIAIEDHYGCGGMHDERGRDCGDGYLPDAELDREKQEHLTAESRRTAAEDAEK